MTLKISTGFRDGVLVTGSVRSRANGKVIRIYGGTVPADANAALGSATLLCEVSVGGTGTGVTFEATPVDGALVKTAAETWSGTNVATGTATFWRLVASADDGTLSTVAERVQGTFGGTSGLLSNPALTSGSPQSIDNAVLALPLAP
jgi:hypothetical protein